MVLFCSSVGAKAPKVATAAFVCNAITYYDITGAGTLTDGDVLQQDTPPSAADVYINCAGGVSSPVTVVICY